MEEAALEMEAVVVLLLMDEEVLNQEKAHRVLEMAVGVLTKCELEIAFGEEQVMDKFVILVVVTLIYRYTNLLIHITYQELCCVILLGTVWVNKYLVQQVQVITIPLLDKALT